MEAIALAYGEDLRPNPLVAARRVLAGRRALIFLDGAEEADDLDTILSAAGSCGVLITSRRHQDAPADIIDLIPLPSEKAVQLLKVCGRDYADDEITCLNICEILGGLPLAVILAGSYLAQRHQNAVDYLKWLEVTPLSALNLGEKQKRSISILMKRSLEEVDDIAKAAFGIAGMLAFKPFESQIIAIALDISQQEADRCLGELVDYGLLQRPNFCYYVTHALAHAFAREQLSPKDDALARLAKHFIYFIPKHKKAGPLGYSRLDNYRAHIQAVLFACRDKQQWGMILEIGGSIDSYLKLQGHLVERIVVAEIGVFLPARNSGKRNKEMQFLDVLGQCYLGLGEPHKAIDFFVDALEICRRIGINGMKALT